MRINIYIAIAVIAGAFLACTKENPDDGRTPLCFSADFSGTKGVSISDMNAQSVGIYGYNTGKTEWATASTTAVPNLLDNQPLLRDNGAWVASTKLYWLADVSIKYNFIAYAPYESLTNGIKLPKSEMPGDLYSSKGIPTLSFEVLSDVQNQIDLLTGTPQINLNKTINGGVVKLQLTHVLTKIGFKAFCRTPGTTMKSLSISNVNYKGAMSLDGNKTWAVDAEKMIFSLELNGLPISTIPEKPTDLSTPDAYFFMMPQDLSSRTDVILTVVYIENNKEKTKSIKLTDNWVKSKYLSYKLDFGGSETENLIISKVTITDWILGDSVDLITD